MRDIAAQMHVRDASSYSRDRERFALSHLTRFTIGEDKRLDKQVSRGDEVKILLNIHEITSSIAMLSIKDLITPTQHVNYVNFLM